MVYADCMHGSYEWNQSTQCMYYTHVNATEPTGGVGKEDVESDLLGIFTHIEDAQAHCEWHHQVISVQGLSATAREILRREAITMVAEGADGRLNQGLKWLEILDAATRADRYEEWTKAGAT